MDQVSLPMRIALLAVLAFSGLWFVALRPKPVEDPAPEPVPVEKTAKPKQTGNAVLDAAGKARAGVDGANAKTAKGEAAAAARSEGTTPAGTAAKATATKPATSNAATPTTSKATAPTTSKPATATQPGEEPQPAAVRDVLADLAAHRTVVLLFWDGRTSDDRAVRAAVRGVDTHGGKVRIHVARIADVGNYDAITRGVPVVTSPTTLVIDGDSRATTIGGLTVTREIDDVVTRALKTSR